MNSTFFLTGKAAVILFCSICFASCSLFGSKDEQQATEPSTNAKKTRITPYQELTLRYKQLWKQNQELRKMLLKFEKEKAEDQLKYNQKIESLTTTLQLLEELIKQQTSQIQDNTQKMEQLAQGVPSSQSEKKDNEKLLITADAEGGSGSTNEFRTPSTSAAVRTVPLVPKLEAMNTRPERDATNESSQQSESDTSVFLAGSESESWHDADLNQPSSPINLKVIPGAKKSYQNAFKTFSNREFNQSIAMFSAFLKRYPNDFDADNSQYWIGQSYYQLENYNQAERAFRKVLRNYEHKETKLGYKTPDAILMLGRIYVNKNKPIKGRYYFEKVIELFPESRSAAKAKREVQSLTVFQNDSF